MLGNTAQSDLFKLLFQNTDWAGVGDAGGLIKSTVAGNLYVALHTQDPGAAGVQTTNEVGYGSYARQPVVRSALGWTVSGSSPTQVANAALISFPTCTGAPTTARFFSIGTTLAAAGEIIVSAPLIQTYYTAYGENTTNTLHLASGIGSFLVNDPVQLILAPGNPLPTGLAVNTTYYVEGLPGSDEMRLSATPGGAAIDITVDGFCLIGKITELSITAVPAVTPQFAIAALLSNIM